jgi:twinkle protein
MSSEPGSEFVRHEPCPSCGSSDALARYSNGSGFCFSCSTYQRGSGDVHPTHNSTQRMTYEGDFAALRSRKITEETCRKFNVRVDSGPVVRFPYYNPTRAVVAYKERDQDKHFRWHGRNTDHQLFGQQLWGAGKAIVITEGELDALSVYQARPTWPVVSIPNGAAAAAKDLKHQIPWLLGFEEIILLFDGDEPGQKAAQDCAALFPPDRVFLAALGSYKDASEALQAGDAEAIRQAVWNKRPWTPQTIVEGTTLFDLVSAPLHGKDADYPYGGLNALTSGLRLGELVTVTAGSGVGKSTFCGEICQALIDQDFAVGYIALEESIKRTALRLMTVKANKPLHLSNEIEAEALRSAFEASVGSGRVYLRDGFGSVDPDVILNDIRFMVKAKGVSWVILDHLSILLSGNESDDERKLIDRTMTKLRSFVEETGIGMLLISHLRRTQGDKGHEDGAKVSMGHLRGSHSIAQLSDLVIAIERKLTAGENTSEIVVLKNRFNGQTGPAGYLTFTKETGRLTEMPIASASTSSPSTYDDF